MPEAEINPTGEVLVEGHHVGEMQGFRFTADRTAEGEDARAVKAAAQKALAPEFELRAERFSAAPNSDLALGSDGIIRWLGAPVGSLVAGDDVLKPRVVLLADEQLTGPARDKVAARCDRFVAFQIESQLKPLIDLRDAETLSGIARGLAFQLSENFGILNRRDVAEDVRTLDQDARAALRRLGIRFGAYHIFVPSLIKPGPAGIATLLWALKNDGSDKPGYGDVVAALAAGRTSIVTDPQFERNFYRIAGFRNLGRRAVRVDILERLADLIRPTMGWKPSAGKRPEGAFDGDSFYVTPAMMSILGATAEDMDAILKGLGYRSDEKKAAEFDARLSELDAQHKAETAPASADETVTDEAAALTAEASSGETTDAAAAPETTVEASTTGEQPSEQPDASVSAEAETAAEEEKVVLVWRQARFERRSNPRQQDRARPGQGRGNQGRDGQQKTGERPALEGQARDGQAQDGQNRRGQGRPGQDRNQGKKRFDNKQGDGAKRSFGNRDRDQQDGGRRDEPRRGQRDDQHKQAQKPARIDPNSPFAMLAALKDQLQK